MGTDTEEIKKRNVQIKCKRCGLTVPPISPLFSWGHNWICPFCSYSNPSLAYHYLALEQIIFMCAIWEILVLSYRYGMQQLSISDFLALFYVISLLYFAAKINQMDKPWEKKTVRTIYHSIFIANLVTATFLTIFDLCNLLYLVPNALALLYANWIFRQTDEISSTESDTGIIFPIEEFLPVFFVDDEGYVFRVETEDAFHRYVDFNDVLLGEHLCWDSNGRELMIAWTSPIKPSCFTFMQKVKYLILGSDEVPELCLLSSPVTNKEKIIERVAGCLKSEGCPEEEINVVKNDFMALLQFACAGKHYEQLPRL